MSLPLIIEDIEKRVLKSGDTLSGDLVINKNISTLNLNIPNSHAAFWINKNTNADADYGTYLVDRSNDGKQAALRLSALSQDAQILKLSDANGTLQYYNILDGSNYTSYVPTLTGTGASGTWPISITGSATTATKLSTARTIFGIGFDGSGNVAGKPLVYGTYTSTAANRCFNSGIEVRENGLVGSAQSDIGYAPSIGFHWSQRIAASLLFHNDGNFYLKKQDGTTRASLDANLIGNASTATKLATARNIALGGDLDGSANFDGSGNITISGAIANCNVSSSNTSNYPWHRIATVGPASNSYNDYEMIIAVRHYFDGGGYGLAKVSLRTNLNSNCGAKIVWLYRYNISMDALRAGVVDVNGATYMDLYYYYGGGWARCKIHRLFSIGWNLINSNEVSDTTTSDKKGSYEVYTSVADGGSKIGRSYTRTITAEDGPVRPTSSGTSSMTANSSGLSTNHVYLQYV